MIAAFSAAFFAAVGFGWLASRPSMALLYGGLDAAQAGDVIAGIERAGVAFEVRGNSIWTDADQRDRLRVELASQGLPASGGVGYELLDGMSGFGTTAQMFDAAYWRAKEGELARTILALPNVNAARVHLAVENGRGYRQGNSGQASVTLTSNGGPISQEQAAALKYLVSSGVPGMQPGQVTVIDTRRGIISSGEDREGTDRAESLKRNVERILESHVGAGNAVVELNLDVVTDTEQLTEHRFDPDQRALISQSTEETTDESNSSGSASVTAASNLPDQDEAAGDRAQTSRSENRQQANYEVSTTTREVRREPGAVRRLSVAVLVNGVVATNPDGETTVGPRPEAELQTLHELVASAVGYDEARGDVITVKSLAFADLSQNGTYAQPGMFDRLDLNGLVRMALIGIFALVLMLILFRSLSRSRNSATPARLDESGPATAGLSGLIEDVGDEMPAFEAVSLSEMMGENTSDQLALPSSDPVERLRSMMRERQDESLKILSGWIENKEEA